ncbi:MAG: tetratricopeptide repeat protein [Alphaproteobacteria bacterium]|nr:MAG: tetratricopeptide repeat protein [Alphaproteobacteria bacterium]
MAEAVRARSAGQEALAEARFRAVLAQDPDHAGALNALGVACLAKGEAAEAASLFERAAAADPGAAPLWINLAKAQRMLGDDEAERKALKRTLDVDQRHLMALIRMAELHERLGESVDAGQRWSGVLAVGRLVDPRPPELEALLAHAAAFVSAQTGAIADLLEKALGDDIAKLGPRDRRRFTACSDQMLGRRAIYANVCAGVHYPFLPADEFFDREHFPWLAELEAKTPIIRREAEALLAAGDSGLSPYVAMESGLPENKWTPLDHSLAWGALHLWREGVRNDEACARCPETAAIVEALPLADVPGRMPTVFFSVLKPKTRIPPHTGVSNARTIIHLPLIVPPGCGFRVGGETREWREGEAFAFDDTIEHAAWNDSDEPRAVLIFDVWNPHLSDAERDMLRKLFTTVDSNGWKAGGRERVGEA